MDHVATNVAAWTSWAHDFVDPGRRNWSGEPEWGIWGIREADIGLLPDVDGKDTVELGCGTAYVSAWLARRGGHPVGIDPTSAQLTTARGFQQEFGLHFPLIRAAGERVPLRDGTFDYAVSEYGAALWADPYRWIPEAARMLRPGGELLFLSNSALLMMCVPDDDESAAGTELLRPHFRSHRWEWPDDPPTVEFHMTHGETIRLLGDCGFEVLDLVELRPGEHATTTYPHVTLEWARTWPCEEAWRARKRG
jgi:SAM-dependent methyltransferase